MIRVPLGDGGHLAVRVEGAGAPLLLVRPLGGSIALWGAFAKRLAECFRVIAFDPRGVGGSSGARAWATTRSMSEDALAVLDRLAIERAHVFGISLGGMVATSWLAADHGPRVDRLVLASTMPWSISARHASPGTTLSLASCLRRPGAECGACVVRRVLSPEFRRTHPSEVRRLENLMRRERFSRGAFLAHLGAAARHDGKEAVGRIRAPTLVLIGERDTIAAPRSQEWLASALGAKVERLGAGHDLTLELPRQTADRVRAFLA
jgi:pimeloyl-ACP methyl ester carboxylesterase